MHTTIRIESIENSQVYTGTGYFFDFLIDNKTVPVVITNKHVIENRSLGNLVFKKSKNNEEPVKGSMEKISINNFEQAWIKHPDQNIDLAILPIRPILSEFHNKGADLFYRSLDETMIASNQLLAKLSGIEDITMIGYPNGIWDEYNNMPIVRKGITATNPKTDYNNAPLFVIDCACFPGSSGSPVFIFDQFGYSDSSGTVMGKGRLILLGTLFAGPQHTSIGEIKTINLPLLNKTISLAGIPNNLGFVIKSEKILDFKSILSKMI
ncbi:MAG: serine protease [Alphaproteobacteria bacterium]|nr:serine protease [Alphaproteobacteria bacterium]